MWLRPAWSVDAEFIDNPINEHFPVADFKLMNIWKVKR
jgi:hypothetical protein